MGGAPDGGRPAAPRLTLEYDGGPFSGWARQPGKRTIQEELEGALGTIARLPVSLTVAGRTDAGVHALAQVASYDGPVVEPRRVNALLPPAIAVLACDDAPAGFDARRDATSRAYCYRVLARRQRSAFERGRALWWPHACDLALLQACAALLPGTHDFTAFTPTETAHRRFARDVLATWWEADGDVWTFWIEADAFMRRMIRVLVGAMLEVGGGPALTGGLRGPARGTAALPGGRDRPSAWALLRRRRVRRAGAGRRGVRRGLRAGARGPLVRVGLRPTPTGPSASRASSSRRPRAR